MSRKIILSFIIFIFPVFVSAFVTPETPRVYLDTTYQPSVSGTCTVTVPSGGNVQAAIDAATQTSHYVICLQAGGTFGQFKLKNKTGSGWITIRTSTPDAQLPPPGTRVNPSHAPLLAKVLGTNPITTESSSHNYRLIGLEVTTSYTETVYTIYNLISIGDSDVDTSLSLMPRDIIIDRNYIHGTPTGNIRRGVAMNGNRIAVIDSYISDIHEIGADTQAIAAWSTEGPLKIVNNYLEGAGENVMFGGAYPGIPGMIPSDIELRNNYFFKPLSWKQDDPSYAGIKWSVKNLLEFKSGRRVLVDGNIFENIWYAVQRGGAVVITPRRAQDASVAVADDLTFTNNIFKRIDEVVAITGFDDDDTYHRGSSKRVLFENNLFDLTAAFSTCCTYQMIIQNTAKDITFNHNTFIEKQKVGSILTTEGDPVSNVTFTNNIIPSYTYGIAASVTNTSCVDCIFNKNVFAEHDYYSSEVMEAGRPGNYFPGPWSLVGLVDRAGGNYRLSPSSPYKNLGTDGKDIGADFDILATKTANVISGQGDSYIPPPPADTTPPTISSLSAGSISQTSSTLTWSTNESSDSQVEYGVTSAYGNTTSLNTILGTSHVATLNSLLPDTVYNYRVKSRDAAGNLSTSANATFKTLAEVITPPVVSVPTINVSSADFGSVSKNSTSAHVIFTIHNPTLVSVGISNLSISGDFSIQRNNCGLRIQPNTRCDVYVAFTPASLGARSGTITFTLTDSSISTLSASLNGVGTDEYVPIVSPVVTPSSSQTTVVSPVVSLQTPTLAIPGPMIRRTLSRGITDTEVMTLQTYLKQTNFLITSEITSYFGPLTEDAVKKFQTSRGIEATGIVGPVTRASILSGYTPNTASTSTTPVSVNTLSTQTLPKTVYIGITHPDVVKLQNILKRLGFFPQTVTSSGQFGPTTKKAVQAFQRQYNIASSGTESTTGYGMVGKKTWVKLLDL